MKTTPLLYTCNVTISNNNFDEKIKKLDQTLQKIGEALDSLKIRGLFFLDTELLLVIEKKHNSYYQKILAVCNKLDKKGHSLELLINPERTDAHDLHQMSQDDIMDVFAQGKHLLKQLCSESKPESLQTIRVLSSKIQPFMYLQELYVMFGAKVDASILPRIKYSQYFDFRSVRHGEIIRFTKDPGHKERFGVFLGIPRGTLSINALENLQIKSLIKKLEKYNPEKVKTFLEDIVIHELVPLPVPIQKHTKLLSPDIMPIDKFKKIIEKQRPIQKNICVLESHLEHISEVTIENLKWLHSEQTKNFHFVSQEEIIKEYSTTYKKHLNG